MFRSLRPFTLPFALTALALPAVASAYEISAVGTSAADLEIELSGSTLTVISHSSATLTHDAGADCTGSSTSLTCDLVTDYIISGTSADDSFQIEINGSSAHEIAIAGGDGDDAFALDLATSGDLHLVGDGGRDEYLIGSSTSALPIGAGATVHLMPGTVGSDSDDYHLYADVHGVLVVTGTPYIDLMNLSGSVVRSADLGGLWEVDARGGDDLISLDVRTIETTYEISADNQRARFWLRSNDQADDITMTGDVTVTGGVYQLEGGGSGDTLDMNSCDFTVEDFSYEDGGVTYVFASDVDILGGAGTDTLIDACTQSVSGTSTWTLSW